MAIVVVGGQSRNLGKTSVVAGIISAFADMEWTAFKLTQFGHGRCSLDGQPCHCATDDHCYAITEENDAKGRADTSRFLAAGAKRSFWVRTEQGRLPEALPAIQRRLTESVNAIFESNSILKFIDPDLYISVLDPATADFKTSALKFLQRAEAVVLHRTGGMEEAPRWRLPARSRIFQISPPQYVTDELVDFVRQRLARIHAERRPASSPSS